MMSKQQTQDAVGALGAEHLLPWEVGAPSQHAEDEPEAPEGSQEDPEGEDEQASQDESDLDRAVDGDTDEEAEDEDEDEDESEESEDEDEDEDEEPVEPDLYVVKVDGKEEKVTLDELKSGYSRTSDYTRKTQALAEKERTGLAQIAEAQRQYLERLEAVGKIYEQVRGAEPDWEKIKAERPLEYPAMYIEWQRRQERAEKVQREQANVAAQAQAVENAQRADYIQTQLDLLRTAIPDFNDEVAEGISKYAMETYGWTADEVSGVVDHRLVLLLRKAQMYDQGQAKLTETKQKVKEKVKKAAPTLKTGSRERPSKGKGPNRRAFESASKRLSRSGSVDDAHEALMHLLGDDI